MIGKLVRTKVACPFAPKGTWWIVIKETKGIPNATLETAREGPQEPKIYTVHLSQEHHTTGHFFRRQLQVVEA